MYYKKNRTTNQSHINYLSIVCNNNHSFSTSNSSAQPKFGLEINIGKYKSNNGVGSLWMRIALDFDVIITTFSLNNDLRVILLSIRFYFLITTLFAHQATHTYLNAFIIRTYCLFTSAYFLSQCRIGILFRKSIHSWEFYDIYF